MLGWMILTVLVAWLVLTIVVQRTAAPQKQVFNSTDPLGYAMVIYNPDPFYNLDERVGKSFARGLVEMNWSAGICSTAAVSQSDLDKADLIIFCANTYNWAPDRAIVSVINNADLQNKKVVAITLGSGSTSRAKRLLEEHIKAKGAKLLDSKTYWLLRPNDEHQSKISNVQVAEKKAYEASLLISRRIITSLYEDDKNSEYKKSF